MTTKYQTLDGKLFNEAADATMHEEAILSYVHMWDRKGNITSDTSEAVLVHLSKDVLAGKIFKKMILTNEKDVLEEDNVERMIADDESGWFYWDEWDEAYRYIDTDILNIVAPIINENSALSKN